MYSSNKDKPISREQLAMLPTPAPLGRFHKPYAFGQYMDDIEHALDSHDIAIVGQEYAVQKDNARMFGVLEIAPKALDGELITADDWKLLMGVRGAHDQSIPRGLSLGSSVFVCSNLMFDGQLGTFSTKQTLQIASRLPGLIRSAVDRIPEVAGRMQHRYTTYKEFQLKPRWGDAFLVELHRLNALSSAQLGRAIGEWDKPCHEEHAQYNEPGQRSAWQLMNACTEALKPTGDNVNMHTVQQRSATVSKFIDEVVGL